MSSLRVLFVSCETSLTSGVGRCNADLLLNLDLQRITPIVVTTWPGADDLGYVDALKARGIAVHHRDLGAWYPPRSNWGLRHLLGYLGGLKARVWALMRLIEEHRIDVVYTSALPTIDAALAARFCGRPHIWHLHEAVRGNRYLRTYLPFFLVQWLMRRVSARLVFVSRHLARNFSRRQGSAQITVIHNGVDLARFGAIDGDVPDLRAALGLPRDTRLVVSIGIVSAHKGHDTLVKAAASVVAARPDTALLLVGSELGGFGSTLRELTARLGVAHRVFFLGPRKDVQHILRQSDLAVLASTQESFSLALVEAMACAKPVVATRCGGPEEIVVEGETGYLVEVGDDAALADRVVRLLSDPALSQRMGAAGRQRAETVFALKRHVQRVEELVEEVHAMRQEARP